MGEAPRSWMDSRCIDDYRPLRVIVVGAGISGILASIRLPQRIPNLSLQIYEKNSDIGGTWFENKYVLLPEFSTWQPSLKHLSLKY